MALLNFWKTNRDIVLSLSIEQIISNAGDGKILDGSDCSKELRQYFQDIPDDRINDYVQECLGDSFGGSGFVLQDLVNDIARRLKFDVEHGLYRGRPHIVGFDGIWRSKNKPDILVEIKTTDVYAISLDKYANYKLQLVKENKISEDASILFVVGREDTGALEAQIRGSKYAWEMRLISADRLSALLPIKEQSGDFVINQIKEILQPFEYTKIDKIIDVIFATAGEDEEIKQDTSQVKRKYTRTKKELLNEKREISINALSEKIEIALTRHSKTLFWSADRAVRVCSVISKRHERGYYWYAYQPAWDNFLKDGQKSFLLITCMDRSEAYAIPYSVVVGNLPNLNKTNPQNREPYWHIILDQNENDELIWNMSKAKKKLALAGYAVPLSK